MLFSSPCDPHKGQHVENFNATATACIRVLYKYYVRCKLCLLYTFRQQKDRTLSFDTVPSFQVNIYIPIHTVYRKKTC